jgi:hypothetical protein
MLKSKIRPLLILTEKGFEDIAADRSPGEAETETEVAGVTKTFVVGDFNTEFTVA